MLHDPNAIDTNPIVCVSYSQSPNLVACIHHVSHVLLEYCELHYELLCEVLSVLQNPENGRPNNLAWRRRLRQSALPMRDWNRPPPWLRGPPPPPPFFTLATPFPPLLGEAGPPPLLAQAGLPPLLAEAAVAPPPPLLAEAAAAPPPPLLGQGSDPRVVLADPTLSYRIYDLLTAAAERRQVRKGTNESTREFHFLCRWTTASTICSS